jgi:hypothetical protein
VRSFYLALEFDMSFELFRPVKPPLPLTLDYRLVQTILRFALILLAMGHMR